MDEAQTRQSVTARDIARILRRRLPLFLLTFLLVCVGTGVATLLMKKVYEARARIIIDSPTGNASMPSSVLDLLRSGGGGGPQLDTEIEKIRSRDFLGEVIKTAHLTETNPDDLKGRLVVTQGPGGQILEVAVRARTGEDAQKTANMVLATYQKRAQIEYREKSTLSQARLSEARDRAKAEKDKADAAFKRFSARSGFSDPAPFYQNQVKRTVEVGNKLDDAQKSLPVQQAALATLQAQLKTIPSELIASYPLNKNVVIDEYQAEIKRLETRRRDLLLDYAPASVEVQEVDNLIADRKRSVEEIQKRNDTYSVGSKNMIRNPDYSKAQSAVYDAQNSIKTTEKTIATLTGQKAQLEAEQKNLSGQQLNYEQLRAAKEGANQAFERARIGLLTMATTQGVSAPYIKTLEDAELPTQPISPKPLLNGVMAVFLGLFLGVAAALFAEYMAGGTHEGEGLPYLPHVAGVPLLGTLPLGVALPAPANALPATLTSGGITGAEDVLREIGYCLAHRGAGEATPVVVIAGTRSDDRAAATTAQIAAALVREGLRVTLVDADRAHPRLNRVFGAPDAPGLADVLAGRRRAGDILHIGAGGTLRFMAAGSPDDPIEATETNLRALFRDLSNPADTDIVLVSGPSVWSVRQIAPLEKAATGMALVVAGGEGANGASPGETVARVRRLLTNGYQPRLMGVIIGQAAPDPSVPSLAAPATEEIA